MSNTWYTVFPLGNNKFTICIQHIQPVDHSFIKMCGFWLESVRVNRSGRCGTGLIDLDHPGWRMGVTKAISFVPLFFPIFVIIEALVCYWISRLYLTGVATAQLRWHQSNIKVIQRTGIFAKSKAASTEKLMKEAATENNSPILWALLL